MTATAGRKSPARAAGLLERSPGIVPCIFVFGVLLWLARDEAGFRGTTWMPAMLLLSAVLLVCLAALPRPRLSRPALFAVLLLAAYGGFCLLSVLWADQEELAWNAGNRTLLYALVLALCSLWPLRGQSAAVILGAFGLGVAAIGLVELLNAAGADQGVEHFAEGRLAEPTGYINANVALWMSGLLPCLVLAGRRGFPPLLRGLLLGASGLLAGMALLGQSRGWLIVLPLVVVLAVVCVRGRGRTLAALAAVAAATGLIIDPLLDVYSNWEPFQPPGDDFNRALTALLLASAGLVAVGTLAALFDDRVRLPERVARGASGVAVVSAVLLAVAGVASYAVVERNPVSAASEAWDEFKEGGYSPVGRSSRLAGGFSTYRYDYWTVAWNEFKRAPLVGAGADNFGRAYQRRGESPQTPSYPHSTEMAVLSETGLVGAVLLGGAFVSGLLAALPGRRRAGLAGAAAGAGILVFGYWLLHGSLDWLWEFPGLAGSAIAGLGLAIAVGAGLDDSSPVPRAPWRRGALAVAVAGAVLVPASVVPPWLSEREQRRATEIAATDPDAALEGLERAADLNPLSPMPDKAAGVIALRQGRYRQAQRELRQALERDSEDSGVYLLLASVTSEAGRQRHARELLEQARRLAPRDYVTGLALEELRERGRLDPSALDAWIQKDVRGRTGRD
jgi:tetratricopeptide (TPR) repeat protein